MPGKRSRVAGLDMPFRLADLTEALRRVGDDEPLTDEERQAVFDQVMARRERQRGSDE